MLVVITRYNLLLPILRLIWGLFGPFRPMRGPSGPQTNIFDFVRVVLVVIYLFQAS
jgi:hypothetical protein